MHAAVVSPGGSVIKFLYEWVTDSPLLTLFVLLNLVRVDEYQGLATTHLSMAVSLSKEVLLAVLTETLGGTLIFTDVIVPGKDLRCTFAAKSSIDVIS